VVLLMLLCAVVGMLLASPEMVSVALLAPTLFGIAAVASSAAVINHLADAQIDARMARTAARPMATRRTDFWQGVLFSAVFGIIGGLIGAAPPLFGWTAVTNQVDVEALVLVRIIFIWTPPHFWALTLDRKEEYATAEIPMLLVTHGEESTRRQRTRSKISVLGMNTHAQRKPQCCA
jgi:protoheme IX farnesyltransferase